MLPFLFQQPSDSRVPAEESGTAGEAGAAGLDIADALSDPQAFLQKATDWGAEYAPKLVGALITLVIGLWVARLIRRGLNKTLEKGRVDKTLAKFLSNLAYMVLMALVLIATVGKLGVETASFVAIFGAAGLAIGFALQGSLGNFASGVMIMLFRPFKVGDYVEAGGAAGTVEEIQVFATIMKSPDNKRVIVPNNSIMGGTITNYSAKPTRRVDMVMGISYDDDIKKAKKVIERIVAGDQRILADPAPVIAVDQLADSSVNIVVRPWVKSGDYWPTYFDLTENLKLEFDKEGISIPFPQRDVHLHQVGAPAGAAG